MTDEAMSPLRRRHDRRYDDPQVSAEDPTSYIRAIKDFAAFLGRSPDTASFETSTLSAASGGERRAHPHCQSHRGCVAVLLQDHAQALRHHRAHDVHPRAPEAARSCSVPEEVARLLECSAGAQIQGSAERGFMARVCAPPR